jgi:LacI family transcriptional regulator
MTPKKMSNPKVTQEDVARRAGVTRSIVSYVLNDTDRSVAPETREKILNAIEELGYRPNKFAQGLMRGNQESVAGKQIGIVLNAAEVFLRPYYTEILAGIHAAAHESSYHIRFIRFFNDLKNPVLFNELIHPDEICGLILVALDQSMHDDTDTRVINNIRERISNIVCVEWQRDGFSSVNFDRPGAAYAATTHLLAKGYKDIVYIGETDNRVQGFTRALIDNGLRDLDLVRIESANDMRSGFDAMMRYSLAGYLPRAVMAGSDEVAIGILRFLNERAVSVPETVALASIDNIEMAEFTNPPLTTINVQKIAMGRQAVQMIIQYTKSAEHDVVTLSLPTNLVVRASS